MRTFEWMKIEARHECISRARRHMRQMWGKITMKGVDGLSERVDHFSGAVPGGTDES